LEDEITALSFTTQSKEGKMLIDKCRKLQAENEKLGEATSEEKVLLSFPHLCFIRNMK